MASRKRALLEPTDDWQQLQLHLDCSIDGLRFSPGRTRTLSARETQVAAWSLLNMSATHRQEPSACRR